MASFDVKSLFTNIPLDQTIQLCVNKLYHGKRKVKGLLKRQCKELLILATKSSCFLFNNTYYCQVDGVAMGSPLGPTLANLFLCHHETTWLEDCPVQFKPVYYRRYVDDVLVLFKSKDHVKKFLRYANSKHPNIEFSYEEEEDNKLPFLDIEISRVNGNFVTSLYRKSTFSGVYLNFNSYLPREYKEGLLYTLLYRSYRISFNYLRLDEEIEKLKLIWQKNSFPLHFIDNCVYRFLNKLFIKRNKDKTQSDKKEVRISLPYLGVISIQLMKRLRDIYRTCYPELKLNVVFNSKRRFKSGFLFKDVIPKDISSLVIYKYKCGVCTDTYIGKTKRHFIVRAYEHLGISLRTNNSFTYNKNNATEVRRHIHDCGHDSSIDNFSIIGRASNDFHLRIKESLLIKKLKPSLNVTLDTMPLKLLIINYL